MTKLISGDITKLPFEVDAIVNPSNNDLWLGSGVSGAIKERAGLIGGEKLQQDMYDLGRLETGDAVITKGHYGDLNCKAIIHTAGPVFGQNNFENLLRRSYASCFKVALDNGVKSIAFPLISSGFFGGKGSEMISLKMALEVSRAFEDIMDVYIVKYVQNKN